MQEKAKQIIETQLDDVADTIHDLFCTLHEEGYRVDPSKFIEYVYAHMTVKLSDVMQDLMDEFDEEE